MPALRGIVPGFAIRDFDLNSGSINKCDPGHIIRGNRIIAFSLSVLGDNNVSVLTILIIRHAEKPGEDWPGPGLMPNGIKDKKSLVIRGWQRAGSWAALFGTGLEGDAFPQPGAIYAADPKQSNVKESSQRPFETIVPLAARLHLTPITTYGLGQETDLVAEVVGLTGVVLICWEHKAIGGAVIPAISNGQTLHGIPKKWDGARFDVVLRFDRTVPGAPWSFRQLFPRLLSGDSDDPMK